MSILVFNNNNAETAHAMELRTGLKIVKGAWKPEPNEVYIIFGAERETEVLLKVMEALGTHFIIINSLCMKDLEGTLYEKLLKKCVVFDTDIEQVIKLSEMGINADFISNEAFLNKCEERPNDYLYHQDEKINNSFKEPDTKHLEIKNDIKYSVNNLIEFYTHSKCYISHQERDWDNINRAISCGCQVISCMENIAMMKMYEKFVVFKDLNEDFLNIDMIQPDFEAFQNSVTTFSLNSYLPIFKDTFLKYGTTTKESKHKITGEDEGGGTPADAEPTPTENEQRSSV